MSEEQEPEVNEEPVGPNITTTAVVRDVVVFQFKLIVDGVRDFVMVPVSLVAAALDILDRGHRPGYHFYRVVRFGRETERFIHLFEAADRVEPEDAEGFGLDGRSLDELIEEVEQRFQKAQEEDPLSEQRIREKLKRLVERARANRGGGEG